ncbi:MAG: LPS-assembly protein LptD [Pseudomonadota bacterium]
MTIRRPVRAPLALLLILGLAAIAQARAPWAAPATHESGPFSLCPPFGPELPDLPALAPNAAIEAEADRARHDGATADMHGGVRLQRGDQRLLADRIRYTLAPEQADAEGNLRYWDDTRILFARQGRFWPADDRGQLDAVRFWLPQSHLSGESLRIERLDARRDRLERVSLSSCPEDRRDWVLEAAQLDLDHALGRGLAHDTWLSFMGMPLLYAPWLDFPLDNRRASGFLYPTIGYGNRRGLDIGVPYYWNIAPDRDATLTARPMSKRGLMLQGEYRQLWTHGHGEIGLDWLPHDTERGESRYLIDSRADSRLGDWNGSLAIRRASDMDFLRDFSLTPWGGSSDYLESHLSATREIGHWTLLLNAQRWQTLTYNVTEAARPYQRMPQIRLSGREDLGPFSFSLDSEAVHFRHERASNPQGQRYAIQPALSLPVTANWYSITPRLALDATHYQLDDASHDRTTPIASLDTRLFFDRFGETLHQQLEPRIHYLYVPFRQQDWALFDTGIATPSLSRLFSPNRFNGRDRLGDANALSYGITWRALDAKEGFERASIGIGQRYRFSEERVTLHSDGSPTPRGAGEIVGEISAGFDRHWRARVTAASNPALDTITQTYALLSYRGADTRLLNLHYAQHTDDPGLPDLEQAGISFVMPVDRHWRLLGSMVHDLKGGGVIRALAGVEYDSCCWRVRVGLRRYAVDTADIDAIETDNAVLIQLELKGLGGGGQADRQFERDILGFDALR